MNTRNWERRLPIMAISALIAPFALAGCGDALEPPGEPPDFSQCKQTTRTFRATMPWSAWPLPFEGFRSFPLSTWKPLHWDAFEGSVHILETSWDIDWVSELRVSLVGHPDMLVWDGIRWDVDSSVDIKPFLEAKGNLLFITPYFEGKGVKPSSAPQVDVEVRVAICGPGQERIR